MNTSRRGRWPWVTLNGRIWTDVVGSPSDRDDPFTGVWSFSPAKSRLAGSPPRSWNQEIQISADEIHVVEDVVLGDGSRMIVSVDGRLDGSDCAVRGSPVADTIAYRRLGPLRIAGIARRSGRVSFTETVTVSADRRVMTMTLSIAGPDGTSTSSVAVFDRRTR